MRMRKGKCSVLMVVPFRQLLFVQLWLCVRLRQTLIPNVCVVGVKK